VTSSGCATTAQFITGAAGPILLTHYRPTNSTAGPCVLIVPPFAEEMNKSRRMFALTARALAAHGIHTVLPDLYGTGDSAGEFSGATIDIWARDLDATARAVEQAGERLQGILALRLGAALTTEYLARCSAQFVTTVFWQPQAAGAQALSQFLRLRVAASMLSAKRASAAELSAQLQRDGVLEVAGYQLSAALARGLQGLQLSAADLAGRLGDVHCIEIGRRDPLHVSAALEQVVAQLTASGVRATAEALLGDAFWGATEIVTNDVVVATTAQHFAARLIS